MAKRLYQKNGFHFIQNGRSLLKLGLVNELKIPTHPGRTIKVFAINSVVSETPNNPIIPGAMLALSLNEMKSSALEYKWAKGEEFQVPLQIVFMNEKPKPEEDLSAL